jgi:predicted phosphodiesterase
MPAIWSAHEDSIILENLQQDKTRKEVMHALKEAGYKRTQLAVEKRITKLRSRTFDVFSKSKKAGKATIATQVYTVKTPLINEKLDDKYHKTIEDLTNMRNRLFKTTTERFIKLGRPVNANIKILTLSDLHFPFVNQHVIEHAVSNHKDANILVLNGDIFDAYLVSHWPKNKAILLQWEYQIAQAWLDFFDNIFPKIVLISGNHEYRTKKYFSTRIDPSVSFLTSPDILQRLAKGYDFNEFGDFEPTHKYKAQIIYDGQTDMLDWYHRIGNALFVHPSKGIFNTPLASSVKAANNFLTKEQDWECLIMAHTHKQGRCHYKNKLLIEQGCCCIPLEYESANHMAYDSQTFGYAVVHMDKAGNVDFDKTRTTYIGTGSPVKVYDALRLL